MATGDRAQGPRHTWVGGVALGERQSQKGGKCGRMFQRAENKEGWRGTHPETVSSANAGVFVVLINFFKFIYFERQWGRGRERKNP